MEVAEAAGAPETGAVPVVHVARPLVAAKEEMAALVP